MTESYWLGTRAPGYPRLDTDNVEVDVAVVGGGITGVTAALLLKLAGKRVALLEARRIGNGVTAGTTGHLTEVIDTRYSELEKRFGTDGAALVAASSRVAIEQIAELDARFETQCRFERLPGYLYSERGEDRDILAEELTCMRRAGLTVGPADVPLPIKVAGGIRVENQAQFHPLDYVTALAARIPGDGSHVFEQTRVHNVDEGEPCRLHVGKGPSLRAEKVVLATHSPLNQVVLQTKVAQYRSYVVSGRVPHAPHGLFWDTDDPYHYTRAHRDGSGFELIVGGEDHKTGIDEHTDAPFERLTAYAARVGLENPRFRWSSQVVEPVDGLPFVGKNAGAERVHVATGFSGNGLTFGTIAALILRDACLGAFNPYAELYDPGRLKPFTRLSSFLAENVDYPLHLVSDALKAPTARSLGEIPKDEGRIVRVKGRRVAAYRDTSGRLYGVSPICTHLGCHVAFNSAEKSWDCPCHGSRFGVDGGVLDGPASDPLERIDLEDDDAERR
jgi:glycine/D-amino acid oxidase-like deaminating enzyme/nitrite reductase/ring-hydroxylating ferredoxin subunit